MDFILLCSVIVMITFLLYINRFKIKEGFMNKDVAILDQDEKQDFIDFENMKCKYVYNKLGMVAEKLDVLKNYILVGSHTNENECYIKNSDTLVNNKCSKENTNIYDDKYADLIDDIYPKLVKDSYMSTTIPQNACVIKFTDKTISAGHVKEYIEDLDYKLPKLQKLRNDIKTLQEEFENLAKKKNNEESKMTEQTSRIKLNQESIDKLQTDILTLDGEITTKHNTLADLENQLDTKRDKYQSVQNLNVKVCHDANFLGKCVQFPIGKYNRRQMELQGMANDSISSLSIPQGLVAKLYYDTLDNNYNPTGTTKFLMIDGRDVPSIGSEKWTDGTSSPKPNDSISSIIVEPKTIS